MGVFDGLTVYLERGNKYLFLYDWFRGDIEAPIQMAGAVSGPAFTARADLAGSSLEGEQISSSIQLGRSTIAGGLKS